MSAYTGAEGRLQVFRMELAKIPAFLRRDFLTALSYRTAFATDLISVVMGAFLFYFVGRLVDPARLPSIGGESVSYLEFAAVGVALGPFVQVALSRVASVIRQEQVQGTLESLLTTPTASATIQVGSGVYELLYIPVRTALMVVVIAIGFGLDYRAEGILPAAFVLLFLIPFVWGLGLVSAGVTLVVRQGGRFIDLFVAVLTLGSGAFFPLELLPGWLEGAARVNPIAVTVEGMRTALISGADWSEVGESLLVLTPMGVVSLALGVLTFRYALRRERHRGTLGLY